MIIGMDTLLSNDYISVLSDPSFRLTAERLVFKCGVRADLKGFRCLIDAIIIFGTGACTGFCEIYRIIGKIHGLQAKSVMREISYAISQAFNLAENLSTLIGTPIPDTDIHNGLVIAYLGRLFQNPSLAVYN